ncbi:uncharacterized protein LOC101764610 [Setaria italica]|uniref:uncharacterized protein LOC101764610 n=1 Tax=Setaria italica TaxID=4555 RepID=UPI000BE5CE65|nr:uncharacterized protein LOC101764610 [Setaria italica]
MRWVLNFSAGPESPGNSIHVRRKRRRLRQPPPPSGKRAAPPRPRCLAVLHRRALRRRRPPPAPRPAPEAGVVPRGKEQRYLPKRAASSGAGDGGRASGGVTSCNRRSAHGLHYFAGATCRRLHRRVQALDGHLLQETRRGEGQGEGEGEREGEGEAQGRRQRPKAGGARRWQQGRRGSELNINIWPFSRSRPAGGGSGSSKPRPPARKVSSAPCSRRNSRGEAAPPRRWAASPGRAGGGVPVGRSSPVWQIRRPAAKPAPSASELAFADRRPPPPQTHKDSKPTGAAGGGRKPGLVGGITRRRSLSPALAVASLCDAPARTRRWRRGKQREVRWKRKCLAW